MGVSWLRSLRALLRALSWAIPWEYREAATGGSRGAAPIPLGRARDQRCCPAGNCSSHCSAEQQGFWIQSPPCPVTLLQGQGTSLCVGQRRAVGRRVAWAAVGKRCPKCEFLCWQGPGQPPAPSGRAGQGGAAGLLSNRSLRGSDASLAHQSLSTAAVECRGKNFSQLPVTCSDAKPRLGKCYLWLSSQLGDTWGTCVLFFP